MRRALLGLAVAASVIALGLAWRSARSAAPKPWNVVLISIDTLRADHLGSYGYSRDTSPRLDQFAREGLRYARALAPTPWTLPSHAALLTGRHPFELGMLDSESVLPVRVPTLAERFRRRGYDTAAFVDSDAEGFLGSRRGFGRGFRRYAESELHDTATSVAAVEAWLAARKKPGTPFFLFVHTKSVHATAAESARSASPYDKPPAFRDLFLGPSGMRFPWREQDDFGVGLLRRWNDALDAGRIQKTRFSRPEIDELQSLYDGGIRYVDLHLGRLLDRLRQPDLERRTVVVITADHGEAFLEQNFFLHQELARGLLEVPLLVRVPRGPAGVVQRETAHLEEIAPTLLRLSGADPDHAAPRLLPGLGGAGEARPHFAYYRFLPRTVYEAWSVEDGPFKLVFDKRVQDAEFRTRLFDLRRDPGEQDPVQDASRQAALLGALTSYFQPTSKKQRGALRMSPEAIERLRSLGYLP